MFMSVEIKVPSPLRAKHSAGRGTREGGGKPATVGDAYGFGDTEEEYRVLILGAPPRGRQRDGPFDHATGKGWVKGQKGQYDDAIFRKKNRVVPFIVESTGGITPHAFAYLCALARRAAGKNAQDRTRYSRARAGTKSYLQHHLRRVSKAAVIYDAMAIRKQITCLKQRVFGCAAHAAGASEAEA